MVLTDLKTYSLIIMQIETQEESWSWHEVEKHFKTDIFGD